MKKVKIAVTGGPSGGKTTLIEALQRDLKSKVTVVPEAASILYRGGFPRRSTPEARKHVQRAIYFVQKELEGIIVEESKSNIVVCDRGSLDSVAYWPDDSSSFFSSLETTMAQEIARYDWVIHLDTADHDTFDTTNPIRTESHIEAVELNTRITEAWKAHPQRVVIPHEAEFLLKIAKAKSVVEKIMNGASFNEIRL